MFWEIMAFSWDPSLKYLDYLAQEKHNCVPKSLGGLEAEALYIDTNTNFNLNRFKEILLASLEKCHNILKITKSVNIEDALRKLHYVRTSGLEKFCSLMYTLPKFIEERPNTRL
ncbi:unnamed protein product [Leptidea sinapis]|uniref:Uncharacterized protein n=1 Tax=Leptidea sinapis TaxID=189913 RepID=A0A5E4R088_9NEOP|nr:unnamed protein product [Leptidea sinapis]